jgi:EAL domain-containing protein (putative c-di-GMP-specific phosphodiesterase class I)
MLFNTDMQDELQLASELQKHMHDSIIDEDFIIYLQPKYNIEQQIIGAEALVRWCHPTQGILAPAAFIQIAEETNMIIAIGDMVLKQACRQLEIWQQQDATRDLHIAVNLSAKQIWQSFFVDDFINLTEEYDIDRTKLIVEVTESVLIQDLNDATVKLSQLKAYGVSISLDDFGTGYSSLSYLRSLPIDEIKIDRSFVQDIVDDQQAYLVVKSIIDLARNFDLKVVSEGVELEEQFTILKQHNVTQYQGYYFSRPITQAQFIDLFYLQRKQPKSAAESNTLEVF